MYSLPKRKKKKKKNPINFKTNNHREMNLIPNKINYCLLQFHALKFFLRVRLHEGSAPNFNFFQCKSPILNTKLHSSTPLISKIKNFLLQNSH